MKSKTITLYDFVEGQAVFISRTIASIKAKKAGPNIVFIGGMHGNEPTGVIALNHIMQKVQRLQPLLRGNVFALAGNLSALEKGERYIQKDLNRIWQPEQVERAKRRDFHPDELIAEVEEQIELWAAIDQLMSENQGEFFFVDLHTTSTRSAPFIAMSDTIMNRRFIRNIPVPVVIGIEEYLTEPLLSYLNELGCVSVAFEGGQHSDIASVLNHEAFILLCLQRAGILKKVEISELKTCRKRLKYASGTNKYVYDVRMRQALEPGDVFQMMPGFDNFSPVQKGQALARHNGHTLRAIEKGYIFMPLYQSKGEDAYFLIRRIARFWLAVSYLFRRFSLYKILRLLPGVRPFMKSEHMLIVNGDVARWFSLEILHLMGYRRKKKQGDFTLYIRRKYDFKGPRRIK
jgi:succinylglutamate desuccinylase